MKVKKQKAIKKDEFRNNKSNGHPAYIYEKQGNDYKFIGITHSKTTKGVGNIKLNKNPDPLDKKIAYARPQAEKDKVNKFKKKNVGWRMSRTDKIKLKKIMK